MQFAHILANTIAIQIYNKSQQIPLQLEMAINYSIKKYHAM